MPTTEIPPSIVQLVAEVLGDALTTREIHELIISYTGDEVREGFGSRRAMVAWYLKNAASDESTVPPLYVLGKFLQNYMEVDPWVTNELELVQQHRKRIEDLLARYDLRYETGGRVLKREDSPASGRGATRSLRAMLEERDLPGIEKEFERTIAQVERDPGVAVASACSIVEAVAKTILEAEEQDLPARQDITALWKAVSKFLGMEPGNQTDDDLRAIVSGLATTVQGLGSLRTHNSNAHGQAKGQTIGARHARLAVHASHAVVAFALEVWEKKRERSAKA